jgi:hypothetical protein
MISEGTNMSVVVEIVDPIEAAEAEARRKEDERKALISKKRRLIDHAYDHDAKWRKRWQEDRIRARGDPVGDCPAWEVSANLTHSIIEVLLSVLYAKNPDISVTPSSSVARAAVKDYKAFAETLEILVSRLMANAGLKKKGKRWVRSTMTVGPGWLKCTLQTRTEQDPVAQNRINDLRDNIQNLSTKRQELADGEAVDEDATRAEIEAEIESLLSNLERDIADGLIIDLYAPEEVLVSPECGEVEAYLDAPWICTQSYLSKEAALAITDWPEDVRIERIKHASRYYQRARGENGNSDVTGAVGWEKNGNFGSEEADSPDGFVRVDEFWSKTDGMVYTMISGCGDYWAREPYKPRMTNRFYPVFLYGDHFIDGERYPQSTVFQLAPLQDEYNAIRSQARTHRKRSIPKTAFNRSAIEEDDANRLADAQVNEMVGIKPMGGPNVDLRTLLVPVSYAQYDQGIYDTSAVRGEMEEVSGAQDALRSAVQVEKTATEAEIENTGFNARVGARRDALEEVLTDLAQYVAELCLQTYEQADVEKYCGPAAVWTKMSVDDALTLFSVEIKAGSTGKPTAKSDRDAFGIILPMLQQMVGEVSQMKMAAAQSFKEGNANAMTDVESMIAPQKALMNLVMQRLDEKKIDIEQFIPDIPLPPVPPPPPVAGGPVVPPELASALAAAGGGAPPAAPPVLPP